LTPCYLLEHTGRVQLHLRRYRSGSEGCPENAIGYHNRMINVGEELAEWRLENAGDQLIRLRTNVHDPDEYAGDDRWPSACACGEPFRDDDQWQVFTRDIYFVSKAMAGAALPEGCDTTLWDCPPGAMWYADWMSFWRGPDGRCLVVKTPGGDWMVDGQASNCTKPEDKEHRCWVRHGDPPKVTAGKDGNTCGAGAGSIGIGEYHGFLEEGVLT
jgi:hypothetical protein